MVATLCIRRPDHGTLDTISAYKQHTLICCQKQPHRVVDRYLVCMTGLSEQFTVLLCVYYTVVRCVRSMPGARNLLDLLPALLFVPVRSVIQCFAMYRRPISVLPELKCRTSPTRSFRHAGVHFQAITLLYVPCLRNLPRNTTRQDPRTQQSSHCAKRNSHGGGHGGPGPCRGIGLPADA